MIIARKIHDIAWKGNYFKSDEVHMIGHGFGASIYPNLYDKIEGKPKMIPRTYTISFFGTKGDK